MGFSWCKNPFLVFIIPCYLLHMVSAVSSSQFIKDPQTLTSDNGNFTLGFFSPGNTTSRYLGIWCKTQDTVVWVANRNQPLNDSSGVVTTSDDGNLVVLDGQKHVIWSSNVSHAAFNSSFQVSDFGSLVLLENTTGNTIWESFQQPSNTLLSHLKLISNRVSGVKVELTSWKSPSNPSVGSFSCSIQRLQIPELFVSNETQPYWRSGPWNGQIFLGIPDMTSRFLDGTHVQNDGSGNVDGFYSADDLGLVILILNSQGQLQENTWDDVKKEWQVTWISQKSNCDVYGICGAFAICNSQTSPICSCLEGFEPRNKQEWIQQNWTSGCVRSTPLSCETANNQNRSADSNKPDGFLQLQTVKVPDFPEASSITQDQCRSQCLENCFCMAYSYDATIGCMSWNGSLVDIQQFSNAGTDLYIRLANAELGKGKKKTIIIIAMTTIIGVFLVLISAYVIWRRSLHPAMKKNREWFRLKKTVTSEEDTRESIIEELSETELQELLQFKFENLAVATNNFHSSNKLGQGGFGPVYKGKLQNGKEIAVKRLSKASGQGLDEFINEVIVLSKLQHRNLVRLLGCCVERNEKMLIYEYMPNKSLDAYVFDPSKKKFLEWRKRFSIIEGIARGLLYLHRDSRLKIIHRDLKASNILLDEELNPKISDFGMARIFGGRENEANTQRIVGTYGYMSPEYAMQGVFSEKSDVFSFGVLLLEIISGRRNSSFYDSENSLTLLGFAWIQWCEDNILALIDSEIYDTNLHESIMRCIHIGLLCVQEFAADRPTMATVISMLNSEIVNLFPPREPAFIMRQNMLSAVSSHESLKLYSINTASITEIHGR